MRFLPAITLLSAILLFPTRAPKAENSGSFPLLKIAPDARSAALGETGVAGSRGAMTTFHNPALMTFAEESQAAFGYSDWLLDMSVQTVATLFKYQVFSAGLSVNAFSVPDLERRVLPSDEPIETFSAHDFAGGASFAISIKENLSVGVTGRWIHQQIYIEDADGFSADIGAAYLLNYREITVAAAVRNMGRMNALLSEESPLPTDAVVGIAGILYEKIDFGVRGLCDAQFYFEDDLRIHAGLEAYWKQHLFLRMGYQTGSELRTFSGGVGIAWNRFGFDYAYQPLLENFDATHRFGFNIKF